MSTLRRCALLASAAALPLVAALPAAAQDQSAPNQAAQTTTGRPVEAPTGQDPIAGQTPAVDPGIASEAVDGGEIVVTGSRIRRPDFETPNPVVTLSADRVEQSGTTNITDFLVGYPALQGSSTSADNSGSRAGIGATGLNLLNLRNLGTERTLVLVDGRRHVASVPGSQAVDINTIPSDLIQRVDVLTGGVSAIYGADGVSGVVNFVMRQDFEGITGRAQAGTSGDGDAGQRLFSVTAGKNFLDGAANFALAYQYGEESRLTTRQRPRLSGANAIGFYNNPDDPENRGGYTGGASNGIPDRIPLNDIRYYDTAREGGIDIDRDGLPDYIVGAGGVLTAFDPGRAIPGGYQQGGSATRVADYGNDLLPKIRRHIVNAIGHVDIAPAVTFFADVKYANVKSFTLGQPTFDYYLQIEPDNPYIPAGLAGQVGPDGLLLTRDNFDLGQRGESITRETFRSVLGFRGDVSAHANYELSYVFGQTNITSRYVGDLYDDRFYAALDAVRNPATGQVTCRVNLVGAGYVPNQPDNYTRDVFSPTTFQPGQCVPLNLFGENVASQAALDFIRVNTTDRARLRQHVVTGTLAGDFGQLFELPGGPIGFALGGEYRKEESRFTPDAVAAQGLTFTNALSGDRGSFDVKEGFAELNAPLLKDLPFAHRLSVGAAVRFSDYSTIGSTTTWKVDGSYAPVRDITFTGTYSKAVRAPNIGELFSGQSQTFEFITDPCNANEIQNGNQYRAGNCQALLSSLGVANPAAYLDSRTANIPGFSGGNTGLSEEEATTWTAGTIIAPRFLPGFTVRADWYDIKLKNAINTVTSNEIARLCVDQPTLDNVFCQAITRQNGAAGSNSAGNITGFVVAPQNVAQFRTAGLDVNMGYTLRTRSAGRFDLQVVGNYLNRLEFIGTPGAPVTNTRQEIGAPKYQVTGDLTWRLGRVTLNYGLQWADKVLRYTNQQVDNNPDIVADEYKYLKQRWQHDIFAAVDVDDRLQVFGGVNNLANQQPDIGTSIYPINSIGRYAFIGARVKTGR